MSNEKIYRESIEERLAILKGWQWNITPGVSEEVRILNVIEELSELKEDFKQLYLEMHKK